MQRCADPGELRSGSSIHAWGIGEHPAVGRLGERGAE